MGLFDRWLKKSDALDNRVLDGCMGALAQGDSLEKRRALYAALRTSRLMLATPGADEGAGPSDGTRPIRFIATQDADGTSMMLAFTSEAALLAWRPVGCTYTVLSARDVFGLALKAQMQTILINPSGPAGGRLA